MSSGPVNLPPPAGASSNSSSIQGAQGSYLDPLSQAKKTTKTEQMRDNSSLGPAQEALGKMQVGAPKGGVVTLPPPTKGISAAIKGMQQPLTMEPDVKDEIVNFRSDLKSGNLLRLPDYPSAQKAQKHGAEHRVLRLDGAPPPGGGGDDGDTGGGNIPIAQSDAFLGTNIAAAAMDFIDIMLQKMVTMNAMTSSFAQFATEFQQFSYEKADSNFNSMLMQGIGQMAAGVASLGACIGGAYNMYKTGMNYNTASAKLDQYSQEMEEKFGSEALSSRPVTMTAQGKIEEVNAEGGVIRPPEAEGQAEPLAQREPQEGEVQVQGQAKAVDKTYSEEEKDRLERGIKKARSERDKASSDGTMHSQLIETGSQFIQSITGGATSIAKGAYDRKQQQEEALSSMSQEGLSRTLQFYNTVSQQATDASTQSTQFMDKYGQGQAAELRG